MFLTRIISALFVAQVSATKCGSVAQLYKDSECCVASNINATANTTVSSDAVDAFCADRDVSCVYVDPVTNRCILELPVFYSASRLENKSWLNFTNIQFGSNRTYVLDKRGGQWVVDAMVSSVSFVNEESEFAIDLSDGVTDAPLNSLQHFPALDANKVATHFLTGTALPSLNNKQEKVIQTVSGDIHIRDVMLFGMSAGSNLELVELFKMGTGCTGLFGNYSALVNDGNDVWVQLLPSETLEALYDEWEAPADQSELSIPGGLLAQTTAEFSAWVYITPQSVREFHTFRGIDQMTIGGKASRSCYLKYALSAGELCHCRSKDEINETPFLKNNKESTYNLDTLGYFKCAHYTNRQRTFYSDVKITCESTNDRSGSSSSKYVTTVGSGNSRRKVFTCPPMPPPPPPSPPGCHPADTVVELADQTNVAMRDLRLGDRIRTPSGFEPVTGFLHYDPKSGLRYNRISTQTYSIAISDGHRLPTHRGLVEAQEVRVGDWVQTIEGAREVSSVEQKWEAGMYHPMTPSGTYFADGVAATTSLDFLPHWAFHYILDNYATLRYAIGVPITQQTFWDGVFPTLWVMDLFMYAGLSRPAAMRYTWPLYLAGGVLAEGANALLTKILTNVFLTSSIFAVATARAAKPQAYRSNSRNCFPNDSPG